jgi:lipopolysaccharide export LptBFGC system permease protein LptF
MSQFELEASSLNMNRKEYDLLNATQLMNAIDSIDNSLLKNRNKMVYNFSEILDLKNFDSNSKEEKIEEVLPDKLKSAIKKSGDQTSYKDRSMNKVYMDFERKTQSSLRDSLSFIESFSIKDQKYLAKAAKYKAEKQHDRIASSSRQEAAILYSKTRYQLRLHQQYSWALICILFLFIGAPLGSIVKKGGYGYPLLIAILFFMIFIILNIMGERLSKSMSIGPVLAAWLPNIVIAPMALFLSFRAINDSGFSDLSNFFSRLLHFLKFKKT